MNYKLLIKKNFQNRYQNSQYSTQLISKHLDLREKLKKKLLGVKILKTTKIKDHTYLKLHQIYCKKKLTFEDKNYVMKMYSKFEVNLSLKKIYKNFKKKTDKRTYYTSYFILGYLLRKIKLLNTIQKLNFHLKLNDFLEINFPNNFTPNEKILIINSLNYEFKTIKKLHD